MKRDRDSYLTEVDEKSAAIFVDLGITHAAPMHSHPYMGYARIFLRCRGENSFIVPHERKTLRLLKKAVKGVLTLGDLALPVGRFVTDECLELIFYTARSEGWREKIAAVMRAYPAYRWEAGTVFDPDWTIYTAFLYPHDKDMRAIRHKRGFRQWIGRGSHTLRPALAEHWFGFASDSDRAAFCDEATAWGFTVEEFVASPATALPMIVRRTSVGTACRSENPGHAPRARAGVAGEDQCAPRRLFFDPAPQCPEPAPMFTRPSRSIAFRVRLSRRDAPDSMDQVSLELTALASRHNGEYNGWGWRASDRHHVSRR